jgi:hypothetical protein
VGVTRSHNGQGQGYMLATISIGQTLESQNTFYIELQETSVGRGF